MAHTTLIKCKLKASSNDRQDPRKPEAKHSHHSKKHEPKNHKHINYQLPEFDNASLFSGSSQAFRMIFAEESEKLENDVDAKPPNNLTIKRVTPGVENFADVKENADVGSNELSGDMKKAKRLQHNNNIINELTVDSGPEEEMKTSLEIFDKATFLQENVYTKLEESHKMHSENYTDVKSIPARTLVDKTTQTTVSSSFENSADKSGYSVKILLNESGLAPRIVLQDASCDKDKPEALVVDLTQDKNIVIKPLHVDEQKISVTTKQNASTMTDSVEMSDLLSKEKLLASTSHPNNATSERRDWTINFSGGLVRSEKESNSSTHIPPSTDISMAVQVGSMEQANPHLESSPAATRLALLDSYEILASPQKNFFARNVTAKRCNTAKLTLMRAILESNLTDEEKVSSISLIYLNSKNASANSLRKQFPVQKMQNQIFEKETSTEYETSDTSGETPPGKDENEDDRNAVRVDFPRKNKRSKKLRRNRFGKNKFTQTDFEYPIIIVPPESYNEVNSKFPKLVKKPLPVSIIPVLRSDSKISFAASSEDDFKAKPILKKKSSPLPPATKDVGQGHKKSSVTFLIDASTQCDMSGLDRFDEDALAECSVQVEPEANFDNVSHSGVSSLSESRGVQELKRERKVSFNTIILTSLFDNEEVEKEELTKSTNVKPTFPIKREEPIKKPTNIPPIHKFLDLIDMEAKLMSQSMLNIQNTISTAVRIFKTEAVTLKDISTEVLNKAIKSLTSMQTGSPETVSKRTEHIDARADVPASQNERRPFLAQEHVQERKIISNRIETIRSPALIPFEVKNSMIKDKKTIVKLEADKRPVLRKTEIPTPLKGKPPSSDDSKSSMERSSNDAETNAFIRKLWKDINAEILAKVPRDSKVIQVPKLTKTLAEDLTHPDIPKDAIEDDTLSSVSHPNKPESLLSGPADLRDFWDFNFGTQSGKRTYSTVPQVSKCSIDDSPITSLSVPSDNFQGMPSLDTQSLVTSCYSTNQTHPRFPGLMLVRSFDSTISNIVNLYNTFTSYAYSTVPGQKEPVKMAHKEVQINSPFFVTSTKDVKSFDVNDKFPPRRHNLSIFPASSEELKPYLTRDATSHEDAYQPSKSTSVPEENELMKTLKIDAEKIELKRNDAQSEEETLDLSVKTNDGSTVTSEGAVVAVENKTDQLCLSCSDEFPRLKSPEVKIPVSVEKTPSLPTKKKYQQKKKKKKEDWWPQSPR